jgi:hypothetical protein
VANDRKLKTMNRGGALQSSTASLAAGRSDRKPFHILTTKFLKGNDVLVHFSDGTAAIFEAEELEKLRPTPKQVLASAPGGELVPLTVEPAVAATSNPESDRPFVLGEAVA